ncbi:MAG: VOC family protein [Myxococcaceae bacterium]|nr:VOC family protein [Myxococcaceae bacterium]
MKAILTVMVSDLDRSLDFYTRTLGTTQTARSGNEWAEVATEEGMRTRAGGGRARGTRGTTRSGSRWAIWTRR